MKIAFFHELPYGGARRAVHEFGRQLKRNHTVDLFYVDDKGESGARSIFDSVAFFQFIPKPWSGHNWKAKMYKDTIELYKLAMLHKNLAKKIDQKNYDFVFVHGSKYTQAPFMLRYLKTTSAYYCQEPLRMIYEELFDKTNELSIERKLYERSTRKMRKIIDKKNIFSAKILLANSIYTKNNIKKAYGLDATVCYMGVDISKFYPQASKKRFDILFVGSMDEADGYQFLQQGINLMKKKPIIRYVLRENEWISDDSVMRKLYNSSKLLTCLGYREPFGLLPLEAQACGIPVVAVCEGGYLDTVKDKVTGFLIKRDPKILAQTFVKLLDNPEEIGKLGENASRNIKENWTWEKSAGNLLKIYREKMKL